MGLPGIPEILVILVTSALVIVPFWKIFAKAGYHPAFSLLMLVPFVNMFMIFFLAFAQWPILKNQQQETIET